ncbi:MAG: hypothetical protein K2X81_18175, partial [Candidatus Obscuribacterales bacterium]|nr:hypothetical protein [Candidatus Obscuribacterales bacterium]
TCPGSKSLIPLGGATLIVFADVIKSTSLQSVWVPDPCLFYAGCRLKAFKGYGSVNKGCKGIQEA